MVTTINKSLIFNDGKYKKWIDEIPSSNRPNLIPPIASNVTAMGTASASEQTTPAWQAFNNNPANYWYGISSPCWLQFRFTEPQVATMVSLGASILSTGRFGLKDFQILGSNNGIIFDILLSSTHPNLTSSIFDYELSNNKSYLIYRIEGNSYLDNSRMAINTFQLKGVGEPAVEGYWQDVSENISSSTVFISDGRDDFSSIPSYAYLALTGNFEIVTWTDTIGSDKILELTSGVSPQLTYPKDDISLVGVESVDSFTLLSTGNAKIAISFNSGITWESYSNGEWIVVENAHSGMTMSEFNTLTKDQIESARKGSTHIRFNYSLSGDAEIDNIEMKVSLIGEEKLAPSSSYDISYDESTNIIRYDIKRTSSYSVNYVDTI